MSYVLESCECQWKDTILAKKFTQKSKLPVTIVNMWWGQELAEHKKRLNLLSSKARSFKGGAKMGKRKQRGKQKGNKQKVIFVKLALQGLKKGWRSDGTKEYQWSSSPSYDWSWHSQCFFENSFCWLQLNWSSVMRLFIWNTCAWKGHQIVSISAESWRKLNIAQDDHSDVCNSGAQYRLLARPTLLNSSVDANFATYHLKEFKALMRQREDAANAVQWPMA